MSSVAVNGVLGFIMLVTLCFTLGEVDKVLDTPTRFPFIEIFYNTTGSFAATNAMTAVLVVTLTASTITEVATASRQLWSFARDEGLPFSSFFAYVSSTVSSHGTGHANISGYTWVEYPAQLRDGVVSGDDSALNDQYRLPSRTQRRDLIDDHIATVCIYFIYRLCVPEKAAWRGTPVSPVVVGKIWNGGQLWSVGVSLSVVCVCIFPTVDGRHG